MTAPIFEDPYGYPYTIERSNGQQKRLWRLPNNEGSLQMITPVKRERRYSQKTTAKEDTDGPQRGALGERGQKGYEEAIRDSEDSQSGQGPQGFEGPGDGWSLHDVPDLPDGLSGDWQVFKRGEERLALLPDGHCYRAYHDDGGNWLLHDKPGWRCWRDGRVTREPEDGDPDEEDPNPIPDLASIRITDDELENARLTPRCLVDKLLYCDLIQLFSPGGLGKTTVMLYAFVLYALGRDVFGLRNYGTGKILIITAEDPRERLVARMREIMRGLALTPAERAQVMERITILDVIGMHLKFIESNAGKLSHTNLADWIVSRCKGHRYDIVSIDPLVSFNAPESLVNDGMQAMVESGRYIIRELDCCLFPIHHTGQVSARAKETDQYSGRGGTALPDGCRGNFSLELPNDKLPLPPGWGCNDDVLALLRHKLSHTPKGQPPILIRRQSWTFETHIGYAPAYGNEDRELPEQLLRFLISGVEQEIFRTRTVLDSDMPPNWTRTMTRKYLARLESEGRIFDAELPKERRQGSRKTFICPTSLAERFNPADNPAEQKD